MSDRYLDSNSEKQKERDRGVNTEVLECVYDPTSDHRRKGVYKAKSDSLKARDSTLQTLVQAILNAAEDDVPSLVRQIRTCESLDDVANSILKHDQRLDDPDEDSEDGTYTTGSLPTFETELSGKMGELRLENGSVRFLGGTSNLIHLGPTNGDDGASGQDAYQQQAEPLKSWTSVTDDVEVIVHLINTVCTSPGITLTLRPYRRACSTEIFCWANHLATQSGLCIARRCW